MLSYNAGCDSGLGVRVRRVSFVPSESMTYSSGLPSRALTKAIMLPSGDHRGVRFPSGPSVKRLTPVPSAFMTRICMRPEIRRMNRILEPSGDHCGELSRRRHVLVRFLVPPPSTSVTKMSVLYKH